MSQWALIEEVSLLCYTEMLKLIRKQAKHNISACLTLTLTPLSYLLVQNMS